MESWNKIIELKKILSKEKKYNEYQPILDGVIEFLKRDFESLKKKLDYWPPAVPSTLICDIDSEQDKKERAETIIDLYLESDLIKDKKFLDYGCGEGHLVSYSKKYTKLSMGYDVEKSSNPLVSNDLEEIKKNGPYDVVLLYDVLDHCESIEEVLKNVSELIHNDSVVKVRCHPWTSRHGSHLYRELNKAYLNLIFNDEELKELGLSKKTSNEFLDKPVDYYRGKFSKHFQIENEFVEDEVPEAFFKDSLILQRIKQKLGFAPIWKDLEIMEAKADSNIEFEIDGSVCFAKSTKNQPDVYHIDTKTDLNKVTAIKLELLTDSRLPKNGPGWTPRLGNLILSYIEADSGGKVFNFRNPKASFSQKNFDISNAIQKEQNTIFNGWSLVPQTGKDHWGIFQTNINVKDNKIRLHLYQDHHDDYTHKLGKIKLSATDSNNPLFSEVDIFDMMKVQFVDYTLKLKRQ